MTKYLVNANSKRFRILHIAYWANSKMQLIIYEKGIEYRKRNKNREHEAVCLGNLGNVYSDLGDTHKAIEFYEQAFSHSSRNW